MIRKGLINKKRGDRPSKKGIFPKGDLIADALGYQVPLLVAVGFHSPRRLLLYLIMMVEEI